MRLPRARVKVLVSTFERMGQQQPCQLTRRPVEVREKACNHRPLLRPSPPAPPQITFGIFVISRVLFQVTLAGPYTLGYIRMFGQEEEVVKQEIQTVTVRSKTELSGSFTLNVTDALGGRLTTGELGVVYINS